MTHPLVGKPRVADAGCWGLVRRYSGSIWAQYTNCGKAARKGHLTCTAHAQREDSAQTLKAAHG